VLQSLQQGFITRSYTHCAARYCGRHPTYLAPQLLVHTRDGTDQQLVAVVQRHLSVGYRLAEPRQVVLGTEEVAQVQQQLEVRQLVGEGPAFLAHPTQFTETTGLTKQ
jgi:hypothetical protein